MEAQGNMQKIAESELILNRDGSVYHLNLLPEDIAPLIITVGDPERVPQVSRYFDRIELKKQKREFVTHTGWIGSQRLTVISTGISTDNIDIVFNELDALANIDLSQRCIKPTFTPLSFVRIGTAGGLQKHIGVDSFVLSTDGIGLEGLAHFYPYKPSKRESTLQQAFCQHFADEPSIQTCYVAQGSPALIERLSSQTSYAGVTVTCGGFYGPQGRQLRLTPKLTHFTERLSAFQTSAHQILNFEMETSGMYVLANMLGHQACSISAIVANRKTGQYSKNAAKTIDQLIQYTLEKLTADIATTLEVA